MARLAEIPVAQAKIIAKLPSHKTHQRQFWVENKAWAKLSQHSKAGQSVANPTVSPYISRPGLARDALVGQAI